MEELHASAKALADSNRILEDFLSRYEEFVTLRERHDPVTSSGTGRP
jgi:hypothetical protein